MDPRKVRLIKGGTDPDDFLTKNYIQIEYNPNASNSLYTDNFEDLVEIEGLKIGDYTFDGAMGTIPGDYGLCMIDTDYEEGYIMATIYLKSNGNEISMNDADVQAILVSIKVK